MKQRARRTLVERVSKQLTECTGILTVILMVTPSFSIGGTSPSAPKQPAPRPAPPAPPAPTPPRTAPPAPTPPRPPGPATTGHAVAVPGTANMAVQPIPSLPIAQEAARMIMASPNPNVSVSAERARALLSMDKDGRRARAQAHLAWARTNGNPNPGYSIDQLVAEAVRVSLAIAPVIVAATQSQPSSNQVAATPVTPAQLDSVRTCAHDRLLAEREQQQQTLTETRARFHIAACALTQHAALSAAQINQLSAQLMSALNVRSNGNTTSFRQCLEQSVRNARTQAQREFDAAPGIAAECVRESTSRDCGGGTLSPTHVGISYPVEVRFRGTVFRSKKNMTNGCYKNVAFSPSINLVALRCVGPMRMAEAGGRVPLIPRVIFVGLRAVCAVQNGIRENDQIISEASQPFSQYVDSQ